MPGREGFWATRPEEEGADELGGTVMAQEQLDQETVHDLREGLALAKGWLELVFRHWDDIEDPRKREMVAGALFGANRVAFVLDMIDGHTPDEIQSPHERMIEEFERIGENVVPQRFVAATQEADEGRT